MRTLSLRSFATVLAAVALLCVATPAVAGNVDKPLPFHGEFTTPAGPPPEPTIACETGIPSAGEGTGHASHLGAFTFRAEWCMNLPVTEVGFTTVVAANGDELYNTWTSEAEFAPDGSMHFTNYFTFTGGTGRFENATGHVVATGVAYPDGSSTASWEGTLAYDASDRRKG